MSPKDNNKQVSAAVRILHQKRDASARATHLMVKNDPLITYETGILDQAVGKRFFSATFLERKIMSTKTITKRIALVAASALALGGFSVISAPQASAAPVAVYTTMYDKVAGYQVVGGEATVTVGFDSNTAATLVSSGVGTIQSAAMVNRLGLETLTSVTSTSFRFTGGRSTTATPVAGVSGWDSVTVVLTSSVAGVQTLTMTPLDADGVPGTAVTKTITWTASGTTAAASWSAYLIDTSIATTLATQIADSTVALSKDKGTAGTPAQVALVVAKLKDGNGNTVSGATVSVTISGPGLINANNDSDGIGNASGTLNQRVVSVTTTTGGWVIVGVSGDGAAGVATIKLTAGTVSVERSVTFTGSAASYTLTNLTTTYGVGAYGLDDSITNTVNAIKVCALDSSGGKVSSGTFYVTSGTKTVATVGSGSHNNASACRGIAVQGIAAGTSTITVMNGATAALSTVTKTIDVEVTSSKAATVTMALDKSTYQPGEPGVLSLTLKNAAGRPVADGTYSILATGLAANLYVSSRVGDDAGWASGATDVTTVGGVASLDFYAPSVSGDLKFTGTTLAATTVTSALETAARGLALTAVASITGGAADANSALALDAANAATDAANNAYDEAQNATQAASDALAAVTALAAQVKSLIASVKKLTAAVAKLKK